jgi:hypothetical protein
VTCDDFRNYWLAREPGERGGTADPLAALDPGPRAHCDSCAACQAWLAAARALDRALGAALVVVPPPEVAALLARIPFSVGAPARRLSPFDVVTDLIFLLVLALGAVGLSGVTDGALFAAALDRAGDVLQALPLLLDLPFLAYVQGIAVTAVEALATLILVGLAILQLGPTSGRETA